MSSDALELALALQRAPIQRFALRDRPLPDDIGQAIRLASAPQPLLGNCAKRLRVPPATLLEAVRFYLQQVLFEPGTDAYRVLGVSADAPTGLIRDHYHWLQRWLHPDRRGEDWEALLATRVTWAWAQLRNDGARHAYDAEHPPRQPAAAPGHAHGMAGMPVGGWQAIPARPARSSWATRILVGLSVGSCLALLIVALTHPDKPPRSAQNNITSTMPPIATPNMANPGAPAKSAAWPAPELSVMGLDATRVNIAKVVPTVADLHQVPAPKQSAHAPPILNTTEASRPSTHPVAIARTAASTPQRQRRMPQILSRTSHVDPLARMQPAAPAVPDVGARPETEVATLAPTTHDTHATPATASAANLLQRTAMARHRVQAIVAYFRRTDNGKPTWQDAPGALSAQRERDSLRARYGNSAALFALDPPIWQLSAQTVHFDATYHIRQQGQELGAGRFSLRMAWTGQDWQLARVKLDAAP